MKHTNPETSSVSQKIFDRIAELPDWRGQMLARLRQVIREADPAISEDWKWGSPVWNRDGLICSIATFKDHVKIYFFKGAMLQDPQHLFNAGLDAKVMRAIDFVEGSPINEQALKELVRSAVGHNISSAKVK